MNDRDENLYDILKISPKASVAEIVSAYHTAKNAFSKDSVATYSLFSAEEVQAELQKLEEAYLTLSNIEKRVEYDRWLSEQAHGVALPPIMTELERKQNARALPREEAPSTNTATPEVNNDSIPEPGKVPPALPTTPPPLLTGSKIEGKALKDLREKRGLSIEDVSRITKVPVKFIEAIESQDNERLPARVYIQGFVKNMATLYKIDPNATAKAYLNSLDDRLS